MEGTIGLAPIPQGFTAQGCCLHYVPESCRRRTRTFIFEVQSFASYIKRHGSFEMEPSPEIASGSSRYECEVFLTKLRRHWYARSVTLRRHLFGRQRSCY